MTRVRLRHILPAWLVDSGRQYRLQSRLIAIIGIVWLAMIVLTAGVFKIVISQIEAQTWNSRQYEAAENAAETVTSYYNRAMDYLWFSGMVGSSRLDAETDLISSTLTHESALLEVLILDGQGHKLSHAGVTSILINAAVPVSQTDWFIQATIGNHYHSAIQYTPTKQPYMIIAQRTQNGNIVAGCFDLSILWHIIADIRFGQNGRIHILDQRGNVISSNTEGNVSVLLNIADRPEFRAIMAAPEHKWNGEYTDFEGDRVSSASADVPSTDWIIVTEMQLDDVYATSRLAGAGVIMGLFILSVVGNLLVRRLLMVYAINPIVSLRDSAIRIGNGDLAHRSTIKNANEIGAVARAFNEMTQRLSDQVDMMAKRNVEMQALAATNAELYQQAQQELVARALVEHELLRTRDELEDRIKERTMAIALTNEQMQVELRERRRAEERLIHDALHDSLTGLPNRALFYDRLNQALIHAKSGIGGRAVVLFLDIDRFKMINDSFGHNVGDLLLIEASARIVASVHEIDTVARMSGDEFGILLIGAPDMDEIVTLIERLQAQFREISIDTGRSASINDSVPHLPILTGSTATSEHVFSLTVSVGVVPVTAAYDRPDDIMRDADTAMYRAKDNGKQRFEIFDVAMHNSVFSQLKLEMELRHAIENHEFEVHYQPIVELADGRVSGVEALMRWRHPERGLLGPDMFIHVAEESGQIVQMEQQVLRMACAQTVAWRTEGFADLTVNVNFSARQFQEQKVMELVQSVLAESGLPPSALKLELTESVAMSNLDYSQKVLAELIGFGIAAMLDDFGTGYSWLGYLKRLPFRVLKIDRSFIKDLPGDSNSDALVRAIVAMAHSLHMRVVAEGVETPEQLARMVYHRLDAVQGFLISKPVPAELLPAVIRRAPFHLH